mmetsp:Transcript_70570/g.228570  ORF Transcript_70570/g.228570 Transcript_70570/m.228570 type:complete len:363 (-) Transcript_70570:498-1586(-)
MCRRSHLRSTPTRTGRFSAEPATGPAPVGASGHGGIALQPQARALARASRTPLCPHRKARPPQRVGHRLEPLEAVLPQPWRLQVQAAPAALHRRRGRQDQGQQRALSAQPRTGVVQCPRQQRARGSAWVEHLVPVGPRAVPPPCSRAILDPCVTRGPPRRGGTEAATASRRSTAGRAGRRQPRRPRRSRHLLVPGAARRAARAAKPPVARLLRVCPCLPPRGSPRRQSAMKPGPQRAVGTWRTGSARHSRQSHRRCPGCWWTAARGWLAPACRLHPRTSCRHRGQPNSPSSGTSAGCGWRQASATGSGRRPCTCSTPSLATSRGSRPRAAWAPQPPRQRQPGRLRTSCGRSVGPSRLSRCGS